MHNSIHGSNSHGARFVGRRVASQVAKAPIRSTGDDLSEALAPLGTGQVSTADLVVESLRYAIIQGRIRPGSRLQHEAVAGSLGVSRQPVREALRQLQAEGFVERTGSRGYRVREFSASEIEESYYLRWLLESEAAYFAALSDHASLIERMALANYGMKGALELQHADEMARQNAEFHRLLRQCSGLPLLVKLIDRIWVGITVFTPVFIPERGHRSVGEHEEILRAIRVKDPEAARRAMHDHVARAAADYYSAGGVQPSRYLADIIGAVGAK
jgi:DNA-binding GntR family transcriptional regulator